jgi:hypothetical protein
MNYSSILQTRIRGLASTLAGLSLERVVDLPVVEQSKFVLVINFKTAKVLRAGGS